jgi:hypothetical protein
MFSGNLIPGRESLTDYFYPLIIISTPLGNSNLESASTVLDVDV